MVTKFGKCMATLVLALTASPAFAALTQIQELTDPVAATATFGKAVAVNAANTQAFVGAPGDQHNGNLVQGSVFVYARSNGAWVKSQELVASDGQAGDYFGYSLAVSGSTLAIGAYLHTQQGAQSAGKVYIFTYANGTWTQAATIIASDYSEYDLFGFSVALDGGTLVVGAPHVSEAGAAYVFNLDTSAQWVQAQKLTADFPVSTGHFGRAVAVAGTTAAIGQTNDVTHTPGVVYIFNQSGGVWSQAQAIAPDTQSSEAGFALAMTTSAILVGAPAHTVGSNTNQGAAYVLRLSGGSWVNNQLVTILNGSAGDLFGSSVATRGIEAVIGAPQATISGQSQGAAYAYTTSNNQLSLLGRLTASNGATDDFFGTSVAVAPLTLTGNPKTYFVGAYGAENPNTVTSTGAAYVYQDQ